MCQRLFEAINYLTRCRHSAASFPSYQRSRQEIYSANSPATVQTCFAPSINSTNVDGNNRRPLLSNQMSKVVLLIFENVFSILSLCLWTVQLLPQVIKNTKSIEGQSLLMMIFWFVAAVFLSAYFIIVAVPVALIIQPHGFGFLALICIAQDVFYRYNRPVRCQCKAISSTNAVAIESIYDSEGDYDALQLAQLPLPPPPSPSLRSKAHSRNALVRALIASVLLMVAWAVAEVALIVISHKWSFYVSIIGIIPIFLIGLGFISQFIVCYRSASVDISRIFLWMDLLGGVFGFLALWLQSKVEDSQSIEVFASVSYLLVVVGDGALLLLDLYYRLYAPSRE